MEFWLQCELEEDSREALRYLDGLCSTVESAQEGMMGPPNDLEYILVDLRSARQSLSSALLRIDAMDTTDWEED